MRGKVAVITGGTSGIGLATASALARQGARVTVLCRRTGSEGARRLAALKVQGEVHLVECDLGRLASVRAAARQVADRCGAVHLLVNNAGVFLRERAESADGLEMTFQVNYLSHFLLSNLLLDRLKAARDARVVNLVAPVDSIRLDFDDLMSKRSYSFLAASARSKLALVLAARRLSDALSGSGAQVLCYYPGLVRSGLFDGTSRVLKTLIDVVGATPAQAAANLLAILADAPPGASPAFFERTRARPLKGMATDAEAAARLWDMSARLAGLPRADVTAAPAS
ncbi:SDR family NAD(P)-dependent oxidoreductase [Sorangium sp. So ce542]|uniref:SDR family NAD(P)-dependent oxidoreductase n=1 Tax=Sorangium sp. So ce542 TaxID=3133316 RepID=UPI003F5EBB4C